MTLYWGKKLILIMSIMELWALAPRASPQSFLLFLPF
jgi:hypothetical protein